MATFLSTELATGKLRDVAKRCANNSYGKYLTKIIGEMKPVLIT